MEDENTFFGWSNHFDQICGHCCVAVLYEHLLTTESTSGSTFGSSNYRTVSRFSYGGLRLTLCRLECHFARTIWRESGYPFDISHVSLLSSADLISTILQADVFLGLLKSRLRDFILNVAILRDELWFSRNKLVHDGRFSPPIAFGLSKSLRVTSSLYAQCQGTFPDRDESKVPLTDEEAREPKYRVGMDCHHLGFEVDMEFWPVEHPVEPPEEDRPVKCPMSDSSVLNDGGMNESRFSESLRKRTEVPAVANRQSTVAVHPDPPVPAVRKRHHTLTDGDHIMMSPLTRMPALPPLPNQNITIFQMLQQFDKFES
ncbi:hypothetical protein CJ030_MR5G017549 [Morella rubra]|uniref:Uncharacterized protein n=1 Tax=Morella rubra TaxID=262757 RepID=A0A6A1VPH5_9ROSI|nr:hypothetical protein CJ030_MR7G016947 [Morella rubra]KAB1214799.1 hypothetical protein CJ030_MR5G017542 [Morella rubra]KAB1214806.1 hypothetical protein CJ030_MR5G017549 [Morella rubra]